MALDDNGNSQIDFVWGNFPMQPNANDDAGDDERWGMSPYPGDSMADYFVSPEAADERMLNEDFLSNQLQAIDSHVIAMRHWQNYPEFTPGEGNTLTVGTPDWWDDDLPAYQYPNIVGLTLDEAKKQLIECGVNPALLVDLQFGAENPYDGMTGNPDWVNAPGADNPGVIIWKYEDPEAQIGTHWDGRPWLAAESDGLVFTTSTYPSRLSPVGEYGADDFSYWHSFVVLQTTDPNKDSYTWWND